jgi:hypothetical protein
MIEVSPWADPMTKLCPKTLHLSRSESPDAIATVPCRLK